MSQGIFNINADELVVLTNKLEQLHRSALPVAVRMTLNDMAFDMKQDTSLNQFDKNFTNRKKNFLKSHSGVNKSPNTFDMRNMVSEMGVIKGKSKSGDLLHKQEFGGAIPNREYLPLKQARIGRSKVRLMKKKFRLNKISRNPVKFNKFIDIVKQAKRIGVGGFLIYKNILFEITRIGKKKGRTIIKLTPLYLYDNNHTASIDKAPFMKPALEQTMKKAPELFLKNAEKRFEKYGWR